MRVEVADRPVPVSGVGMTSRSLTEVRQPGHQFTSASVR
jgi:hypothetical protein